MKKSDCTQIGYVSKSFGYKGDLIIKLDVIDIQYYTKTRAFFFDIDNEVVPFFPQQITEQDSQYLKISFIDIDSNEKAARYVKCSVYLPTHEVKPEDRKANSELVLTGFDVIDNHHGLLGKVKELVTTPQQSILVIDRGSEETMVPLVDEFIVDMDQSNKTIISNIPDELLDIN